MCTLLVDAGLEPSQHALGACDGITLRPYQCGSCLCPGSVPACEHLCEGGNALGRAGPGRESTAARLLGGIITLGGWLMPSPNSSSVGARARG
eukprot:5210922-Pyramimonas_sp.AAC.1